METVQFAEFIIIGLILSTTYWFDTVRILLQNFEYSIYFVPCNLAVYPKVCHINSSVCVCNFLHTRTRVCNFLIRGRGSTEMISSHE